MDNVTSVVTVNFQHYKGGYLATCKAYKGFFITHRSLARVYTAVPEAIRLIFKAKFGMNVTVEEAAPLSLSEQSQPIGDVAFLAKAA